MERRGQVTRVLTNYGQLETGGTEWLERKVKPSRSDTSRVTGDSQARFCEGLGVKFPGPTRPGLSARRCHVGPRSHLATSSFRHHWKITGDWHPVAYVLSLGLAGTSASHVFGKNR